MATCRVNARIPLFISIFLSALYFIGLLFAAGKSTAEVIRDRKRVKSKNTDEMEEKHDIAEKEDLLKKEENDPEMGVAG